MSCKDQVASIDWLQSAQGVIVGPVTMEWAVSATRPAWPVKSCSSPDSPSLMTGHHLVTICLVVRIMKYKFLLTLCITTVLGLEVILHLCLL